MNVFRAFLRGAIYGFVGGFLLMWLVPVFDGTQPADIGGIWAALCAIPWFGVFFFTALLGGIWAGHAFWYGTGPGQGLRFWGWISGLWR